MSTTKSQVKPAYADGFKRFFGSVHFQFPQFKHDHPPVMDVNKVAEEHYTLGQRVADKVASGMGSWQFIIGQTILLALWAILNSVGWWVWKWDAYPFIAMNLLLSCQAAYAAPVIMMSQNRQAEKDRLTAQNDYQTDMKGEVEIRNLMEHLDHQDTLIFQIIQRLEAQHQEMLEHLSRLDPETAKQLGTDIVTISEELTEPTDEIGGNS
ncbi:MAG TPA: DUF1003 domain-containing protein [Ktedonobacteraceae bacterium]|nr:DUF1003 domain-containing protein [Ktedonobacteraceae bacterium]HYB02074.1 DUF1003 domain-containing protein [Ktedonobacteraceae bacterium]